jgi:uncharacterized protein YehS (DUF1456 family)
MDYKQPPLNRGVNPLKMNWLWRLICQVGYIADDDVASALHHIDIHVNRERVLGWLKSEDEDGYFPLTIAELEQNLRALLAARSESLQLPKGDDSKD